MIDSVLCLPFAPPRPLRPPLPWRWSLGACGSKPATPIEPSRYPPVHIPTITITASGRDSEERVQINVGDRVRFVNSDTRAHNMTSDP